MSAFDLTDADAQGLDALAAAKLRLALRFAERAEAAEDVDEACKLARTSDRAARSYRQLLLVKAKLRRDRDAALREAAAGPPPPPSPQEQARINRRRRDLCEAVERVACEALEDQEDIDFVLEMAFGAVDDMAAEPGFADADPAEQVDRIVADLGLDPPCDDAPGDARGRPAADAEPRPDDSS